MLDSDSGGTTQSNLDIPAFDAAREDRFLHRHSRMSRCRRSRYNRDERIPQSDRTWETRGNPAYPWLVEPVDHLIRPRRW